jgi:hypothetical protein
MPKTSLERLVFEALRDGASEQNVVALLKALSKEPEDEKCYLAKQNRAAVSALRVCRSTRQADRGRVVSRDERVPDRDSARAARQRHAATASRRVFFGAENG